MRTTTALTVNFACFTSYLSFFKGFLNVGTLQKLHVEVPGEQEANVIEDIGMRVDGNN
jgi:hypothetical protein